MKKITIITILGAFLAITLLAVSPVQAKEIMLSAPIKSMVTKADKNGNEYVRFIVTEQRELNGTAYTVGTAVMCFGDTVAKAKEYSEGDTLNAIVNSRFYKGRKSYTLIAFPE
jgi:hypothetical protein